MKPAQNTRFQGMQHQAVARNYSGPGGRLPGGFANRCLVADLAALASLAVACAPANRTSTKLADTQVINSSLLFIVGGENSLKCELDGNKLKIFDAKGEFVAGLDIQNVKDGEELATLADKRLPPGWEIKVYAHIQFGQEVPESRQVSSVSLEGVFTDAAGDRRGTAFLEKCK